MEKAFLNLKEKISCKRNIWGIVYMKIRFLIFKKVKTAWGQGDIYNITNEDLSLFY